MKVEISSSNKSIVLHGTLHCSILEPILSAIYINDLPNCLTRQCKEFADDMKIHNKSFICDIVQIDINNMVTLSNIWFLYYNTNNLMHCIVCAHLFYSFTRVSEVSRCNVQKKSITPSNVTLLTVGCPPR